MLGVALSALARHYGFTTEAAMPRAPRVRHWGSDGYRPSLDGDDAQDGP